MNMQKSHLAKKATAFLSAIAVSSLLGLPALAGSPVGDANKGGEQAQAPSSPNQMQCTPTTQSNLPSTTATPDASAPAAAQLPNQSDPRAGLSPSDQTASSRTGDSTTSASSMQASEPSNTSSRGTSYGDVLAQGGATAGGFASRQVSAANNPEAYRTVSSRYSSNQERPNYYSSGTGMTRNTGSTMSANESMRSDTMSQPSSQSRTMTSTTIALCPDGMTTPQSAAPDLRQAPSQSNLGNQTTPQQKSPQQMSGNETRQSPANDNGSRAR